ERLRLADEALLALDPLPVPGPDVEPERAITFDACRLFVDRARVVCPSVVDQPGDRALVAAIARKLDGLPLALELCAVGAGAVARRQLPGVRALRFGVLVSAARGVSPRAATLRGAIDWSWSLLAPAERDALARCSVFRGGFALDAAATVLGFGAGAA